MQIYLKYVMNQKRKKKNISIFYNFSLVIDEVKDFEPTRRCWRLVGGVLIEKTVGEVVPALKENIDLLNKAIETYQGTMQKKEKEIFEYEKMLIFFILDII